jgi:hypothetical protein
MAISEDSTSDIARISSEIQEIHHDPYEEDTTTDDADFSAPSSV